MSIYDLSFTKVAHAAGSSDAIPAPVAGFIGKVDKLIINPAIILLFAAALVFFLFGVVDFIMNADNPEKRSTGQQHMIWGIIGMSIMFGVWAILRIIENTLGVSHNSLLQ